MVNVVSPSLKWSAWQCPAFAYAFALYAPGWYPDMPLTVSPETLVQVPQPILNHQPSAKLDSVRSTLPPLVDADRRGTSK